MTLRQDQSYGNVKEEIKAQLPSGCAKAGHVGVIIAVFEVMMTKDRAERVPDMPVVVDPVG
jgi:hypothetical protein